MAIKNFNYRLAEVGKIKIGTKGAERTSGKGGKYRLPTKLEHFSVTTLERDKEGILIPDLQVMQQLGPEPKEIDIMLLYDDVDLNFQTCYAYYAGKKCRCRGNGEKADRILNNGTTESVECNPETCPHYAKKTCKISGILSCVLLASNQVGEVYKFRTHGYNSVSNIYSSLTFIRGLTNGVLASLKFKLTLSPKTVDIPSGGTSIIYMANIIYEGETESLLNNALQIAENRIKNKFNMEALEHNARKSILLKDTDNPADVEEEYYADEQKVKDELNNVRNNFSEIIETKFDKLSDSDKYTLMLEISSKIDIKIDKNLPVWSSIIGNIAKMQTVIEMIKNFIEVIKQPETVTEKDVEVEPKEEEPEPIFDEKEDFEAGKSEPLINPELLKLDEQDLLSKFNTYDMTIKSAGKLAKLNKFNTAFKKDNNIKLMLRKSGVNTLRLYLTELEKEFDCLK